MVLCVLLVAAVHSAPLQTHTKPDSQLEGVACFLCEKVGEQLKAALLNNSTEEYIVQEALKACAIVPVPFLAQECKALVQEYGLYYVDLLVKEEVDVKQICSLLKLCPASLDTSRTQIVVLSVRQDPPACEACVDALVIVKTVLASNWTADLIHQGIDAVCDLTAQALTCKIMVKTILDETIKTWVAKFDPRSICITDGACKNSTSALQDSFTLLQNSVTPLNEQESLHDDLCEICEDVVGELKKVAGDGDTGRVVGDSIALVCQQISIIPFCNYALGHLVRGQVDAVRTINVKATCRSVCH